MITNHMSIQILFIGLTKVSFTKSSKRISDFLDLIHIDVNGPLRGIAKCVFRYFINSYFISKDMTVSVLLIIKDELFEIFGIFQSEVQNYFWQNYLKKLRYDRSGK